MFRYDAARAGYQMENGNVIMNDDDDQMSSITVALLKLIQFASHETRGNKGFGMGNPPGCLNPVRRNRNTMVRRVCLLVYVCR